MARKILSMVIAVSMLFSMALTTISSAQTLPSYAGEEIHKETFDSFSPVYNENSSTVTTANSAGTTFTVEDGVLKAERTVKNTENTNPDLNLVIDFEDQTTGTIAVSMDVKFAPNKNSESEYALTVGQIVNPLTTSKAKVNGTEYSLTSSVDFTADFQTVTAFIDLDADTQTLFINGVEQANVKNIGIHSNYATNGLENLTIKIPRGNGKCVVYLDNILVEKVVNPLEKLTLGNEGTNFISGNLPTTFAGNTITYEASEYVAEDGIVTLPYDYTEANVVAKAVIGGTEYTRTIPVVFTPKAATTYLNNGFGVADSAATYTFTDADTAPAASRAGWYLAKGSSNNAATAKIVNEDSNKYLNMAQTAKSTNYIIKHNLDVNGSSVDAASADNFTYLTFEASFKDASGGYNKALKISPLLGTIKYNSNQDRLTTPNAENIFGLVASINKWQKYEVYINDGKATLYRDGTAIYSNYTIPAGTTVGDVMSICIDNLSSACEQSIDNILLQSISKQALAQSALDIIVLPEIENNKIELPTLVEGQFEDASITWVSDKPQVIDNDGNVYATTAASTTVTLTATATVDGKTATKDFAVTIENTIAAELANTAFTYDGSKYITDNLPNKVTINGNAVSVTYTDASGIVDEKGIVTLPSDYTDVTVVAKVTIDGEEFTRTLNLTAVPFGTTTLLNTGFGASAVSEDVSFSKENAISGWKISNGDPANSKASFILSAFEGDNVLKMNRTETDTSDPHLQLKAEYSQAPANVSVIKFDLYRKDAGTTVDLKLAGMGSLQYYRIGEVEGLFFDISNTSTKLAGMDALVEGWNEVMLVTEGTKMDVYTNGTFRGSVTLNAAMPSYLDIQYPRNTKHPNKEIYLDNILVQSFESHVKYIINDYNVNGSSIDKVNVSKYIGEDTVKLYVATYNSDDSLYDIEVADVDNTTFTSISKNITLTAPVIIPTGGYAKAFIFDNTLAPLANVKKKITGSTPSIFLIGDSTVCNWSSVEFPYAGWGSYLGNHIPDAEVINCARAGESSVTYKDTPWEWNYVKNHIKSGDYALIQLAINDAIPNKIENQTSKEDYKTNLKYYIDELQTKGAIPVLVTPQIKMVYANGQFTNPFEESGYGEIMEAVAKEEGLVLLDLSTVSQLYANSYDYDTVESWFTIFDARDARYEMYPSFKSSKYYESGKTDPLHLSINGAKVFAKLLANEISCNIAGLENSIR